MNDRYHKTKHVLIVDDEADFAALIALVLKKQGYEVAVAYNAVEAWKQIGKRTPDLITLDLQMPHRSGLHLYREVKSHESLRHIPVIVISGVIGHDPDMKTLVRSFLETDRVPSPEAYIEKPFDNQELVNVIGHILAETECDRAPVA